MKKRVIKLMAIVFALAMMLGFSMQTYAAEGKANVVDNVIYCTEGSFNITEYGASLSIASPSQTDIIPINVSGKLDVNGKDVSKLIKTDCNYKSVSKAFSEQIEKMYETEREKIEAMSKEASKLPVAPPKRYMK